MDENTIFKIPIDIWAIVAPFVGVLLGTISTWLVSARRIDADLRASTRLEWISEVRNLTAKIIKLSTTLNEFHCRSVYIQKSGQDSIEEIEFKLGESINLYKLYFSTKKKNKFFILKKCVSKLRNWLDTSRKIEVRRYVKNKRNKKMHNLIDKINVKDNRINFQRTINDFRQKTSDYLKIEWDKAKNNK